ncbi:hypothetical protein DSO57_1005291 [Entomophthora muscae]|uniref:Uncharacterized protein n=1 Tax=Entomophthora muscae TaxID=34485 RepID=A0ACC2TJ89_9FUNG|nr:hypothetical protein DSO57_1005291 [Entomophthora muscae]
MSSLHQCRSQAPPRSGTLLSPPPPPLPSNLSQDQDVNSLSSSYKIQCRFKPEDPRLLKPSDDSADEYSTSAKTRLRKRKSLIERQKARFGRLFKDSALQTHQSSFHFRSDDEELVSDDFGLNSTSEVRNLLQGCYATIAGLRVEVDSWQVRSRDAQSRVFSLEEDKRLLMAERNVLQQRLLEAEQDSSTQRSRAQTLSAEVDTLDLEIDKLSRDNHRLRKLAYRQDESDGRIAELEEMLSESQRITTATEVRYQKLLIQNEKLKKAHRKLQQSAQRGGADAEVYEKVAWLRESNEKLQFALSNLSILNFSSEAPPSQTSILVGIIHQLIIDNGRLKADTMGYCDLIADIQAENHQMRGQVQSFGSLPLPKASTKAPARLKLRRRSSLTPENKRRPTLLDELKKCETPSNNLSKSLTLHKYHSMEFNPSDSRKRISGIFTTDVPMKHLYQDGWMSVSESESEDISYSRIQTPIPTSIEPISRILDKKPKPASNSPPLELLVMQTQSLFNRLQASEPKILNRKLQRSFNLPELAPISNTLITNIQQNIELLSTRFQPSNQRHKPTSHHSRSLSLGNPPFDPGYHQADGFLELVSLVQNLLSEIANLRLSVNYLSLAFVDKMNDISQLPSHCYSQHWPSHSSPKPPSIIRCIPPRPNESPCSHLNTRRHSRSTPESSLQRSPMQTRNGIVDYSPRSSLSLDPALVTPTSPLIPHNSCIPLHFASSNSKDVLRKLVRGFRLKPSSSVRTLPSSPLVSVSCNNIERAAVICHTYSLTGANTL